MGLDAMSSSQRPKYQSWCVCLWGSNGHQWGQWVLLLVGYVSNWNCVDLGLKCLWIAEVCWPTGLGQRHFLPKAMLRAQTCDRKAPDSKQRKCRQGQWYIDLPCSAHCYVFDHYVPIVCCIMLGVMDHEWIKCRARISLMTKREKMCIPVTYWCINKIPLFQTITQLNFLSHCAWIGWGGLSFRHPHFHTVTLARHTKSCVRWRSERTTQEANKN